MQLSDPHNKHEDHSSRANTVIFIIQDFFQDSILWAGTRHGLMRINKETGSVRQIFYRHPDQRLEVAANSIRHIYPHPNGKLYLSTWNGGMLEFDPATEHFNQFLLTATDPGRADLVNQIEKIFPRNEQELYVSHTGGYEQLYIFNIQTRKMSGPLNNCGVDYIDRAGNLWNMTAAGLQLYHRQRNKIERHYFPQAIADVVEKIRVIKDFDNNGKLLLKFKGKRGIVELDRNTGHWRLIPLPAKAGSVVDGYILEKTGEGILTNDLEVLYLMVNGTREFKELPFRLPAKTQRLFSTATADGSVFISSMNNQFFWLKPGLKEIVTYNASDVGEPFPGYFGEAKVSPTDQFGRPWMVTSGGYSIFDPRENRFLHFPYRDLPDKILSQNIDLWPDHSGRMWCNGMSGLGWIDPEHPEQGMQQRFDNTNGFNFKDIWYPKPNSKGQWWLIAQQGVACFDPSTSSITPMGTYAFTLDPLPNGELAIGLERGVGIFHSDSVPAMPTPPRPYLSWLKVFENEIPRGDDPFSNESIHLEANENTLSIGFSAQHFFMPGNFKMAYQLAGVNRDWVYPDINVRSTTYSNLAGGDYVFRLKVADVMDQWGLPFEIPIHVATPWYETSVARCLYLLLAGLVIGLVFLFQKRRYELKANLEAKQIEAQRLMELNQFKSRFFTNITHEFRTPLTVILGMAETLRNGKNGHSAEAAALITNNGRSLLHLVNQMLDLAKLEAGSLQLHPIQADVMLFLKVMVQAFISLATSKKQSLAFYADPENITMDFDPKYLRTIVTNLVANALKFTPEYGSVMVVAKSIDGHLELSVKDSGPGIPASQLENIFERFFQVDTSLGSAVEGTGIGLALTKELVQSMKGNIEVKSQPGEGAIFKVSLPITRSAPIGNWEEGFKAPGIIELAPQEELVPLKDFYEDLPILLVIEDNKDLVRYLAALLQDKYHLLIARNGREGVEKAFEFLPDIVLSDVMMPEMDGLGVCDTLKNDERTSHIPIILLSAKTSVEDRIKGLSHGPDAYLEKPFNEAELFVQLKNSINLRQRLIRRFSDFQTPTATEISMNPGLQIEDAFLKKVRQLIEEHFTDESFTITQLYQAVAMSRSQFHRKLKALTGTSATFFIRSIRLARAQKLLSTTDLTISEIAYQVGFKDPNYFSRVFTEEFGVPPSMTRK
jgi:signal transduction histidine kinase/DNA-binding response OmpR family regulator/streptogramin lyase